MMIKAALLAGALGLGVASFAAAQPMPSAEQMHEQAGLPPGGQTPLTTPQFIKAASQSDEFERREGRLAETKSTDPKIRKFAATMVSAHTMTTENLHKAIMAAGMSVPPPPPQSRDQMKMMTDLRATSGADFNRTYMAQQQQAHLMALGVMTNYSNNGDSPALKTAAADTAPIIRHHLQMIQGIENSMGH